MVHTIVWRTPVTTLKDIKTFTRFARTRYLLERLQVNLVIVSGHFFFVNRVLFCGVLGLVYIKKERQNTCLPSISRAIAAANCAFVYTNQQANAKNSVYTCVVSMSVYVCMLMTLIG